MTRFRMAFIVTLGLLMLAAGTAVALAQQPAFERYVLPGDAVYPEGIAYQDGTGDFFVSSTTDGSILRGNVAREQAEVFIPGGTDVLTGSRGMKVDSAGRLYICAGPQGQLFIYNVADKSLVAKLSTNLPNSFLNDVSIAPDGSAYVTDSNLPNIYRVAAGAGGEFSLERWVDVSPTIVYTQGFNLGGIDVSDDGRYVLAVQGNTGKLYRVEVASKNIVEVNLGGVAVTGADGIWLDGTTLYVIRNSQRLLVTIRMASDLGSGTVISSETHPSFGFPTTLAKVGDRLLVVNSQFDKRASGAPVLPFTVSNVPAPVAAQATATAPSAPSPVVPTAVPATPAAPPDTPMPLPTEVPVPIPGMPTTGAGDGVGFGLAMLAFIAAMAAVIGTVLRRGVTR